MPIARCGHVQFSWDTPMWCKGGETVCENCPLNIKFKKEEEDYE